MTPAIRHEFLLGTDIGDFVLEDDRPPFFGRPLIILAFMDNTAPARPAAGQTYVRRQLLAVRAAMGVGWVGGGGANIREMVGQWPMAATRGSRPGHNSPLL